MFTGLIEDVGTVRARRRVGGGVRLLVATAIPAGDLVMGESIAVNGACLTVTEILAEGFAADVSPETLQRSTLDGVTAGRTVNLERALRFGDRLGGHLVSGHVDAVATLAERARDGNAWRFSFHYPPEIGRYLVLKGSVAVDGISLTVSSLTDQHFEVAVVPHTLEQTTLADLGSGDPVNIETDLIGKYLERLLAARQQAPQGSSLNLETLAKHGFL